MITSEIQTPNNNNIRNFKPITITLRARRSSVVAAAGLPRLLEDSVDGEVESTTRLGVGGWGRESKGIIDEKAKTNKNYIESFIMLHVTITITITKTSGN